MNGRENKRMFVGSGSDVGPGALRARRRFLFFSLTAALLSLVFLLTFVTEPFADEVAYKLGPGDRIKVTVFGHPDLSGDFELDGAGRLSFPLIQQVMALNMSVEELEAAIKDKLQPDFLKNPQVSVEVLNYRPFYIFGEVRAPGSYPYVNGMTVVNAIAMAGGYTYRAKENSVVIVRANDPAKTEVPADHDTLVLPGDVIEVPERFF